MHSALYEGWLRHRRFEPCLNNFRYRVSMVWLDLDELDFVFCKRWFWSAKEFNFAWFRRADYMIGSGHQDQSLADAVRERVRTECGSMPLGPIRLLTNLRAFGFAMNPVSFYYCYNSDGVSLHSIVAEITNTPWNEQFSYVLPCAVEHPKAVQRFQFQKAFHVSPFMDMHHEYDWRFNYPAARLAAAMVNRQAGRVVFDSTLLLARRAISTTALASTLLRFPLMTLKVFAAIYFQAARLLLKRVPSFAHPKLNSGETIAP